MNSLACIAMYHIARGGGGGGGGGACSPLLTFRGRHQQASLGTDKIKLHGVSNLFPLVVPSATMHFFSLHKKYSHIA